MTRRHQPTVPLAPAPFGAGQGPTPLAPAGEMPAGSAGGVLQAMLATGASPHEAIEGLLQGGVNREEVIHAALAEPSFGIFIKLRLVTCCLKSASGPERASAGVALRACGVNPVSILTGLTSHNRREFLDLGEGLGVDAALLEHLYHLPEPTLDASCRELDPKGGALFAQGDLMARDWRGRTLPPGSAVVGNARFGANLQTLPDGFGVGGNLDLAQSALRSLPPGLKVGGNLDLRDCHWDGVLPEDAEIGGHLFCDAFPDRDPLQAKDYRAAVARDEQARSTLVTLTGVGCLLPEAMTSALEGMEEELGRDAGAFASAALEGVTMAQGFPNAGMELPAVMRWIMDKVLHGDTADLKARRLQLPLVAHRLRRMGVNPASVAMGAEGEPQVWILNWMQTDYRDWPEGAFFFTQPDRSEAEPLGVACRGRAFSCPHDLKVPSNVSQLALDDFNPQALPGGFLFAGKDFVIKGGLNFRRLENAGRFPNAKTRIHLSQCPRLEWVDPTLADRVTLDPLTLQALIINQGRAMATQEQALATLQAQFTGLVVRILDLEGKVVR